jgi:hypothetical protein
MENNFAVGGKSKVKTIFFCLLFLAVIGVFFSKTVGFVNAD